MKWFGENDWSQTGNGESGSQDSGSRSSSSNIFRLKIFTGMEKGRDVLYLDDRLFRFYEHHGKDSDGKWSPGILGVCRKKNSIGDGLCPPCEVKEKSINLYGIGFLTAIDVSFGVGKEYRGSRRMYLCEKRLVGAKAGTQEHPGPMADLNRLRERHGRLKGLVIHQLRKGSKSPTIGDTFEVVEELNPTPEAMIEYLKFRVRNMIKDGTIKAACQEVGVGMPNNDFYQEKIKLDLEPYDYEKLFQPMGAMELARHFNLAWTPPEGSQPSVPPEQPDDPFQSPSSGSFDYGDGAAPPDAAPSDSASSDQEDMPF